MEVSKPPRHRTWSQSFDALVACKNKFGHTNIPVQNDYDKVLGRWAYTQKRNFDLLPEWKRNKLTHVGFDTSAAPDRRQLMLWNLKLEDLAAFKKKYGHTDLTPKADGELGQWVLEQRNHWQLLGKKKQKKLAKLGFNSEFYGGGTDDDHVGDDNKPDDDKPNKAWEKRVTWTIPLEHTEKPAPVADSIMACENDTDKSGMSSLCLAQWLSGDNVGFVRQAQSTYEYESEVDDLPDLSDTYLVI